MSGWLDAVWGMALVAAQTVGLPFGAADTRPLVHGYVEGEYLRIAAPAAGVLEHLSVARGQRVAAGAPLFTIDRSTALAERDRLAAALAQAKAQRADLATGKRPEEIAVLTAQKAQAEAALRLSAAEWERQAALTARKVSSADKLDSARAAYERDQSRLAETQAQLAVGGLGARPD
jgi:HlyD family secretion protein